MHYSLPYKTKQFFFVLIKLSIVFGAGYFIYNKLNNNGNLSFARFIEILSENDVFSLKNVGFLVFLSSFNWFLEILKWQYLVFPIKKITFKNALEQSLGALTSSLFTPNRIGEYGAKAMYYTSNYRKQIVFINLLSNVIQMSITVILGIIGFSFFVNTYDVEINYYKVSRLLILVFAVVVLTGFGIKKSKFNIKGFSIKKLKNFLVDYPKSKLYLGFLLSLLRYLIFSFQFFVLLHIFKIEISYLNAMMAITSMYFLASILPSIFIFDVIIKGSVAVFLFSYLDINELIILSIITIMWLLNFVLPSIFGSYYVLNFKLPKSE